MNNSGYFITTHPSIGNPDKSELSIALLIGNNFYLTVLDGSGTKGANQLSFIQNNLSAIYIKNFKMVVDTSNGLILTPYANYGTHGIVSTTIGYDIISQVVFSGYQDGDALTINFDWK